MTGPAAGLPRRAVLKGLAATGKGLAAAGVLAGFTPLTAFAAPASRLTLLLAGSAHDDAFLAGARAIAPVEPLAPPLLSAHDLGRFLDDRAHQHASGRRFMGLLDDGAFIVFQEILHARRARFLVTGHHARQHRFTSLAQSRGMAAALAAGLERQGLGYRITEKTFGAVNGTAGAPPPRLPTSCRDWASITAAHLARLAAGNWRPGATGSFQRNGTGTKTQSARGLVSFVAEL
jgi:hypothetical protein